MRVTILDYGTGNLHSLAKALATSTATVCVERDAGRAVDTDVLVLPGVGAFGHAAAALAPHRSLLRGAIENGLPTLGICLGMQLLLDESDEGAGAGLGVIAGRVERMTARRSPQMGWNRVEAGRDPLLHAAPLDVAYYANRYVCRPADERCVAAWSTHETQTFPAMIRRGRTVGVQFHPEKSSSAGVAFIHAFLHEVAA